LLNRVELNINTKVALLTHLDASGNIIWCKTYRDSSYTQCPYTIGQDNAGNFVLYANVSPLGGGKTYNMICKINSDGDVIWTKFYDKGGTWGGAIITSDDGVLIRAGDVFVKTNSAGNVEWTSRFSSSGTYYYITPVEVADGYIFNKSNNGTNEISFYKISKTGTMLWGERKTLDYLGRPPSLRKKGNGNFTATFDKTISGKNFSTVVEFDKDLNVIHRSSVNYSQSDVTLYGKDVTFLTANTAVLAGTATVNGVGSLFFAKMNGQYQTSCDTTLEINITSETVTQSFESTIVTSYNVNAVNRSYVVDTFSVSVTSLCVDTAPMELNIGDDTFLCPDATLTLENNTNDEIDNYLWSTGEITAAITIDQPGTYWLAGGNNCRADSVTDTIVVEPIDCDCNLCVPDAFTPNGGGIDINNKLYVFDKFEFTGDALEMINFKIFNRWGEMIFEASEKSQIVYPEGGWDGTHMASGKKMEVGVYVWSLEAKTTNGVLIGPKSGNVSLIQ